VSALAEHLADYLRMRRALGFELGRHGQVLPGFVAYLEAAGASRVTVELAVAWARQPERIKPITVSQRLSTVRGFARYLQAIDRPPRFRRLGCSPSRDGDQRPTFIHRTRSSCYWSRPGGCGRRCARPPTGR
jgi:integrase/recombinase XerD